MCPATMQGSDVTGIIQIIGFALVKIGSAVIDKLPMLFAVGVAIGLSKDQHGAAGLAGLVAFLTVTTVLNSGVVATMMGAEEAPRLTTRLSVSFPVSQRPFVTTSSAARSCPPRLLSSQESAVCPSLHPS
jgi:PTS system N-acetylglucosamine-specific IIC component